MNIRKMTISINKFTQYLVLIALIIWGSIVKDGAIRDNWEVYLGWLSMILFANQLIALWKNGCRFGSFEIWFIGFCYLFMLGRLILTGVLGVDEITSEGYVREIFDSKYSEKVIYQSIILVNCCIQGITCGLLSKKNSVHIKCERTESQLLFTTGVVLLIIGIPSHLIYSIRMITQAQMGLSYNAITDSVGFIDDFANFIVPGMLALIFSSKMKKRSIKFFLLIMIAYLVLIMISTGDRRYQTVTLLVIIIAYIWNYDYKFSCKHIIFVLFGIILLNVFIVLRNTRTSNLLSVIEFLSQYCAELFSFDNGVIKQTLYEFGVSLYTVCLAIQYVPAQLAFRFGSTIFSGILATVPIGFLYQDWGIYTYGRLAPTLMAIANTTVGGSMFADFYGNFGWGGGIIFSVILGIIFSKLFKINVKNNEKHQLSLVKYYTLFYALIHLTRASFTEVIRTAVWCVGTLYLVYYIILGGNRKNAQVK